jgi:hypothetical protein
MVLKAQRMSRSRARNGKRTLTDMNGLDLLLTYSPFSEHMHQLALACLFKEVAVTRAFGLAGTPRLTDIETSGRLFDITVAMEDGAEIDVEIKLDAVLDRHQLQRQRENIENSRHGMLYLLLGGSQFVMSGDDIVATWAGGYETNITITHEGTVTLGPAIPARLSVPKVLQLGEIVTILGRVSSEISSVAVRELADAYRRCLEELQNTFSSWKQTTVSGWTNAHWNGFYNYVRASLFTSATISNRFGPPRLSWGYRDLDIRRIAVDDFLAHGVHLEAEGSTVFIKLDVLEPGDPEYTNSVRADNRFRANK